MRKGKSRIIRLTDLDPNRPVRDQLLAHLRRLIQTGAIDAGARLPAQRALAKELKLSRNTVIHAYEALTSEGLLTGRKGAGTYVTEGAVAAKSVRRISAPVESALPLPLAQGIGDLSLFPIKDWQRLQNRRWRSLKTTALGYGDPAGWSGLRLILAQRVAAIRGIDCSPDQIHIVPSTVAGVRLTAAALSLSGQTVLVEAAGYRAAWLALEASGARLSSLIVDDLGADIDRGLENEPHALVVYLTPTAQFPTGAVLSRARRKRALDWASENNRWILEEDYESDFVFEGAPAPPLASQGRGRVIHLATLNNVMFPSLRLAYLILPDALVDCFAAARRTLDAASDIPRQMVMQHFMEAGFLANHIRRCKEVYAERRSALRSAFEKHLAPQIALASQPMGLHVTAWLKHGENDLALENTARRNGVTIHALSSSARPDANLPPGFYAGFAAYPPALIERAVHALAPLVGSAR